jgi:GMP synthase-like glutamine amidotransferase
VSVALVTGNGPTVEIRRLGEWLAAAGLRLETIGPEVDQQLPSALDGYAALVVLGVEDTGRWRSACQDLLREAVRHRVPTLAVGAGAQLLATAHGGTVAPAAAGPELGPQLVARRDAAEADPLFARVPFTPDVLQWHRDEITELPAGAVLLAASTRYPHQAFRLGTAAWGLQFHIEPDAALIATWASERPDLLRQLGRDPDELVAACEVVMDDLAEVWQPFAARFAALARGELTTDQRTGLPLLGA